MTQIRQPTSNSLNLEIKSFFVNDAWMLNGICVDFNAWITGITAVLVKNFIKLRRKELLIIPTPSIPVEIVMAGMVGSH